MRKPIICPLDPPVVKLFHIVIIIYSSQLSLINFTNIMDFTDLKKTADRIGILGQTKDQWRKLARIAVIIVIVGWAAAHIVQTNIIHATRICDFTHTNCHIKY